MKSIGNFLLLLLMIALAIMVVPSLVELICFVLVVALQVIAILFIISFLIGCVSNALSAENKNGEKTWNYA